MNRKIFTIFITLLISVGLIGFSYWYVNSRNNDNDDVTTFSGDEISQDKLKQVRGISADDHILGNPEAKIVFYVYSDFACPYCKQYHETLRTLFTLYGDTGGVAYVFRHMPVVELHPNAPMYALASECVAEHGELGKFWKFTDMLFEQAESPQPPTAELLVQMAETVGVNRQSFVSCMRANTLMEDVQTDYEEAIAVGSKGTPFTIVEAEGERSVLSGAQPLKSLAYLLKTTLGSLEGGSSSQTIQATDFANIPTESQRATGTSSTATSSTTTAPSILDGITE